MRPALLAVLSATAPCVVARADYYGTGYDSGYDSGYTGYTEYNRSPPPSHQSYQSYPSYQPYQPYCDCSKYELLGFGSGVASLATFGALLLLSQVNATGSGLLTGRDAEGERSELLTRAAVSVACRGTELIQGEASWADIGQDLLAAALRSGGARRSPDLLRRGARLVSGWHALAARGGVSGRSGGGSCDCFPGLAGAVTGFAALGGIAGYSLYQSNRALRAALTLAAMTTTATTTTATTTTEEDGGQRREVDGDTLAAILDDFGDTPEVISKLDLLSHMADLLLGTNQLSCQQYELCQLGRRARAAGQPYTELVTLASLPLSSIMATKSGNSLSALCWAVSSSGSRQSCARLYPDCGKH